jgi:hypothetical protein
MIQSTTAIFCHSDRIPCQQGLEYVIIGDNEYGTAKRLCFAWSDGSLSIDFNSN